MGSIEASGRRLGIYIAVCDDPQLRAEMIDRYEQALSPAFRHYRLTLNADEPSLKALLVAQVRSDDYLQQGGQAVMTILGAERLGAAAAGGGKVAAGNFLWLFAVDARGTARVAVCNCAVGD